MTGSSPTETRFEFGRNWHGFVRKNFTQERCDVAKRRILSFIGRESAEGMEFLDIGCGSGIHSLAMIQAGAKRVHSFDYDPNSVAAARILWERAGRPAHWTIERGDALDEAYMAGLGQWPFVYSWGVLHHTGRMWDAIRNAQARVAAGGEFYIALYSADADFQPSKEFWLEAKPRYVKGGWLTRRRMEWWYVWNYLLYKDWKRLGEVIQRAVDYKMNRGMDLFADIRDWLGGWPMEYAGDQETVDLLERDCGFRLTNAATGEACSEFLFVRSGTPDPITNVKAFVAARKAAQVARAQTSEA